MHLSCFHSFRFDSWVVLVGIRRCTSYGSLHQIVILCHAQILALIIQVRKCNLKTCWHIWNPCVLTFWFYYCLSSSCKVARLPSGPYKWWSQPDACWGAYYILSAPAFLSVSFDKIDWYCICQNIIFEFVYILIILNVFDFCEVVKSETRNTTASPNMNCDNVTPSYHTPLYPIWVWESPSNKLGNLDCWFLISASIDLNFLPCKIEVILESIEMGSGVFSLNLYVEMCLVPSWCTCCTSESFCLSAGLANVWTLGIWNLGLVLP